MSGIPRPSTEITTIEDKHFKKQEFEINLISGGIRDIGPILHICLNADKLLLPDDNESKALIQKIKTQAENYVAEGSAMTPNGYGERQQLLELLRDALKLNVTIAQKGRGNAEQDSSEPEKR